SSVRPVSGEPQDAIGEGHNDLLACRRGDVDQTVRVGGRLRAQEGPLEFVWGAWGVVGTTLSHVEVSGPHLGRYMNPRRTRRPGGGSTPSSRPRSQISGMSTLGELVS